MRAMATEPDLDHLAVAADSAWDLWSRYGGDLGGRYVGGGPTAGFHWSQARFAGGMKIEMLEPMNVEEFDFLRRFLDHSGPGPHHITFKVPDLAAKLDELAEVGVEIVGVNLDSETWKECFLHPRSAHGIVVQVAQEGDEDGPILDDDAGMPPGRNGAPAHLVRLEHLVADLDGALSLFTGPLAGEITDRGAGPDGSWVDLRWPGPGRIRLRTPTDGPAADWLGHRPGRLHHVTFGIDDPAAVTDAVRGPEPGTWIIGPDRNRGVGLRLIPR